MQKYYNSVQDTSGKAISGASITVTLTGGGTPIIYSDNGITPVANPLLTDVYGRFFFYAADGRYTLAVTSGSINYTLTDIVLLDGSSFLKYALDAKGNTVGIVGAGGAVIPFGTSGLVKLQAGSIVSMSTSNLTLLDTSGGAGTTMTQIGMLTIPGGVMGPTSRLIVHGMLSGTGGNGKTTTVRAGPSSGTFATATSFSGQSGLTNQLIFPLTPMIWNNGTLASQKATPSNIPHFMNQGNNTTPIITASIDTSLDWNIYFGVQFGLLNGGDSMTLNQSYAQILN